MANINKTYVQDSLAQAFVLYKKDGLWRCDTDVSFNDGTATIPKRVLQSELTTQERTELVACLQRLTDLAAAKVGEGDF